MLSKHTDSATVRVMNAIATNRIVPLYNYEILAEYDEVLHRKNFHFEEERIRNTLAAIQQKGVAVNSTTPTKELLPDKSDVVFYEVVMEKRDENAYLVTGNLKHFPHKTFIVTPAEMLQIVAEAEEKEG
ncbi:MAG: PIN domain-containing protein [Thermoguttaceae bacterium]|nr:PIN domain-containing protein [Thermoguttaceae bacterium]